MRVIETVTVYGLGGYDPNHPTRNVIEEYEFAIDMPDDVALPVDPLSVTTPPSLLSRVLSVF